MYVSCDGGGGGGGGGLDEIPDTAHNTAYMGLM